VAPPIDGRGLETKDRDIVKRSRLAPAEPMIPANVAALSARPAPKTVATRPSQNWIGVTRDGRSKCRGPLESERLCDRPTAVLEQGVELSSHGPVRLVRLGEHATR
jgi:hypothetical protein